MTHIIQNDYIAHYGVLGMRWGIRRYQPYPKDYKGAGREIGKALKGKTRGSIYTEEHTLKKGLPMYRVTFDANEKQVGPRYVTYLAPDRDLYRGGWVSSMRKNYGKTENDRVYENKYKLKDDIKIPSRETLQETSLNILKRNKSLQKEMLTSFYKLYFRNRVGSYKLKYRENWEEEFNKGVDDFVKRTLKEYGDITVSMASNEVFAKSVRSMTSAPNFKSELIKQLQKQGYDAMIDEAGVGGNDEFVREGIEPLIIFDSEKSLEKISTKTVGKMKQKAATRRIMDWQSKANFERKKHPGSAW